MWTRAPHLAGLTGLSRFYDFDKACGSRTYRRKNRLLPRCSHHFREARVEPHRLLTRDALLPDLSMPAVCAPTGESVSGLKMM